MKYLQSPQISFNLILSTFVLLIFSLGCGNARTADAVAYSSLSGVPSSQLEVDLYPCSDFAKSLVVYVHGGAWTRGDKANVHSMPQFFAQNNVCFASVNYPLTPLSGKSVMDLQVSALSSFDSWLDKQALHKIPYKNITLIGHSAGAHLIALVDKRHGWGVMVRNLVLMDSGSYNIQAKLKKSSPRYKTLMNHLLNINQLSPAEKDALLTNYSPTLLSSKPRFSGSLNVLVLSGSRPVVLDSSMALVDSYDSIKGYRASLIEFPWTHQEFPRKIGEDPDFSEFLLSVVQSSLSAND